MEEVKWRPQVPFHYVPYTRRVTCTSAQMVGCGDEQATEYREENVLGILGFTKCTKSKPIQEANCKYAAADTVS